MMKRRLHRCTPPPLLPPLFGEWRPIASFTAPMFGCRAADSNMVKQAQSKQKIIDKMVEAGLTDKVQADPLFRFSFPNSEKLPPPVMAFQNVSFAYSGKKEDYLYTKLEFGIDCDSRIALVGPNGAGKSTLLKLMTLDIEPTEGDIRRNPHLRIGRCVCRPAPGACGPAWPPCPACPSLLSTPSHPTPPHHSPRTQLLAKSCRVLHPPYSPPRCPAKAALLDYFYAHITSCTVDTDYILQHFRLPL